MHAASRYKVQADALLSMSRKFQELSVQDACNAELLEECAAHLSAIAEVLVLESQDAQATAPTSALLH
jgi:hypothetical protein